jgi:hypothetical protein
MQNLHEECPGGQLFTITAKAASSKALCTRSVLLTIASRTKVEVAGSATVCNIMWRLHRFMTDVTPVTFKIGREEKRMHMHGGYDLPLFFGKLLQEVANQEELEIN